MKTILLEFWEIIQPEIELYVRKNTPADDVDDIIQEIFHVALKKFDRFIKSDGGREKNVLDFKKWAYSIAKIEILNLKKRNKRHDHVDIDLFCQNIAGPVNEIEESVDKMTFAQLISCLNDKDKSLIALRLLDDMPYEYIAEKTGDNIINLKTRYHRAIKRLKKIFN